MTDQGHEAILVQARELSRLIRESHIFQNYQDVARRAGSDKEASRIIELLVDAGSRLNSGETATLGTSVESRILKEGMEKNTVVQEFILAQKDYLNLLGEVVELVKNPQKSEKNFQ